MQERHQAVRRRLQISVLAVFVGSFHLACGQSAPSPSLDEILIRLEGNLKHYDQDVPNFICNEHVVSSLHYDKKQQSTVTDSVFRVVRNASGALTESHAVEAVNGTPAKGDRVDGPTLVSGVFIGGLDTVSLSQSACMRYTLQPMEPGHPNQPYVIQFTTLPNTNGRSECVLQEEGAGRVFVDPATLQVTRMQLLVPHHGINAAEEGVWRLTIDYAPVTLAGRTFWMPSTLTSTAVPSGLDTPLVYSFSARYSDYHKLEVSSRIVPAK